MVTMETMETMETLEMTSRDIGDEIKKRSVPSNVVGSSKLKDRESKGNRKIEVKLEDSPTMTRG